MTSGPRYGCPVEGCIEKYENTGDLASHMAFSSASGHHWETYASAANACVQEGIAPNEPPLAKYVVERADPSPPEGESDETPAEETPEPEPSDNGSDTNPLYEMPEPSTDEIEHCPRCGSPMHGAAKGEVYTVEYRNGILDATMEGGESVCESCDIIKDDNKTVRIAS